MPQALSQGSNDSVRVCVRIRPLQKHENGKSNQLTLTVSSDLLVSTLVGSRSETFPFDHVFWSIPADQSPLPLGVTFSGQEEVFTHMGIPSLDSAFEGYNATVFAYGQTASGKTYTMMGHDNEPGLIPRLCHELFHRIAEFEKQAQTVSRSTSNCRKASFAVQLAYMEVPPSVPMPSFATTTTLQRVTRKGGV